MTTSASRTSHIPITFVQIGSQLVPITNRAYSLYYRERYNIDVWLRRSRDWTVRSQYAHNPRLISYMEYDTPDLYWLVCLYNGIYDATGGQLEAGRVIRLPDRDDVSAWLSAMRNSQADVAAGVVRV